MKNKEKLFSRIYDNKKFIKGVKNYGKSDRF